jgi:HPt (histidine-containing phosphotransfer) domain-containing protein
MNDHITKPINVNNMFNTMAHWITPARPAPEQAGHPDREQPPTALPDIPGIDIRAGLATTQGNAELYRRLLLRFLASYRDFAADFAAACQDEDETSPTRSAHTLKGVAASIGAAQVAEAAGLLETACQAGHAVPEIQNQLSLVCAALEPVIEGLATLVATTPAQDDSANPVDFDATQLKGLLQRLSGLLADCDVDAADLVRELRPTLESSPYAGEFQRLEKWVDDYEFEDALTLVQQWLESLSVSG